jgi:predicted NBD/HSP70 family sugar kinase
MGNVIAVDVGGTKIAASVVDSEGNLRSKIKVVTEQRDTARSIAQIVELAHHAAGESRIPWSGISAVGVAVPGIYYNSTGLVWAPNLPGWDHIPLRDLLAEKLPVPVVLDSDRAAYVTGEQWLGVARGLTDVIFLAVGTGIGAGIISGGRLIRGAGDIAGAVGWFALDPRPKEIYQRLGCFEAEAAGPSLARRAGGAFTTETIIERARQGDPAARQIVDETVQYLSMGVANLVSALNPQMIVLGGGLGQMGRLYDRVPRLWGAYVFSDAVATRLVPPRHGDSSGVRGAAWLWAPGEQP